MLDAGFRFQDRIGVAVRRAAQRVAEACEVALQRRDAIGRVVEAERPWFAVYKSLVLHSQDGHRWSFLNWPPVRI